MDVSVVVHSLANERLNSQKPASLFCVEGKNLSVFVGSILTVMPAVADRRILPFSYHVPPRLPLNKSRNTLFTCRTGLRFLGIVLLPDVV